MGRACPGFLFCTLLLKEGSSWLLDVLWRRVGLEQGLHVAHLWTLFPENTGVNIPWSELGGDLLLGRAAWGSQCCH